MATTIIGLAAAAVVVGLTLVQVSLLAMAV
jgi:hypothetical protein